MQYWRYLQTGNKTYRWICFLFFILALLSKPAAVIFPLVLLLLDYWKERPLSKRVLLEKILFFIPAVIIGIITVKIQSPTAMAGLDVYPMWLRPLFACYSTMIYFVRFFIPYPLSAYHPFPPVSNPGAAVLGSPLFMMALLVLLWIKRKDKLVVLGILFFLVNLLLVMQVLTIGLTIVSERYTYVPYIGLAFLAAMLADRGIRTFPKKIFWVAAIVIAAVFGFITFRRTDTWKDSGTLWTDVINRYPNTTYPRTNRANYVSIQAGQQKTQAATDSLYRLALEDCNIALKINPNLAAGYEKRGLIYLGLGRLKEALADGEALVKRDPKNKIGYDVRGTVYFRYNQPEKALVNYDTCILLKPDDHRSYSNRGTIYLNYYQKYKEALQEYNKAISISPLGSYYLNRSICYYRMGDLAKARADADSAVQKGTAIPDNLKNALQIK
jgi:tetratricopeptide (TPR) repeat protein